MALSLFPCHHHSLRQGRDPRTGTQLGFHVAAHALPPMVVQNQPRYLYSMTEEGHCLALSSQLSVAGVYACDVAEAVSTSRRALRGAKVPESEFTTLPNGLKYYDLKVGGGVEAVKGSRVAVHYVAKWKGITFMTSRQGLGVGGGTPYGFDVGQSERGTVLKGLDLGVRGMRVGGQRLLIVPPELAYGSKGVQEIPPNATIELDVELLAIKQSPFGSPVKIVEG
ncbi:peptidyl-prolyl cis-trans isomerase FKBP16-4, chloroplastic-like isoform X3 [Juglans microcarpa x Juglans regia]|uniref:peptidyl-prolyl cis-trans isomerase FKBP16-4, chloroplastic-like isoform X3 n=1 Tax=Juglans microcarpa x Juglans regia TaxID=2249226 RepID=UPI001B7E4801|nr:peptidyl-prolyl cis-trans isomerase FKBP16-4, chloroplastic-like isoform X3 [Juglans microcarpa x Juglans regia]